MSKGQVKMEVVVDLFTVAKVEHVAREQGRDVGEVAAELLEKEADKEINRAGAGLYLEGPGAVVIVGNGNTVSG